MGSAPLAPPGILADVGDIARFPDRGHFASWTGTAPIDASSGQHLRHRLSRAGNRRLNHVLYIAGIVQLRHDTPGRAYYRSKRAAGKTSMEAMRCLRRRLSDAACRQLVTDAAARAGRGPGRALRGDSVIQRGRPSPGTGTSDQPLPGPAPKTLPPPPEELKTPAAPAAATSRRRARGVNVERPTGRTTLTPTSAVAHSTAPGPRT